MVPFWNPPQTNFYSRSLSFKWASKGLLVRSVTQNFIHTHIYIHLCIHIDIFTCLDVQFYIPICKFKHWCIHIHVALEIYIYIHTYVYIKMHVCLHIYLYIYMYVYMCIHMHKYIYKYVYMCLFTNLSSYIHICDVYTNRHLFVLIYSQKKKLVPKNINVYIYTSLFLYRKL